VKTANFAVFCSGWFWQAACPPRGAARARSPRPSRGRGMRAGLVHLGSRVSARGSEHLRCGSGEASRPALGFGGFHSASPACTARTLARPLAAAHGVVGSGCMLRSSPRHVPSRAARRTRVQPVVCRTAHRPMYLPAASYCMRGVPRTTGSITSVVGSRNHAGAGVDHFLDFFSVLVTIKVRLGLARGAVVQGLIDRKSTTSSMHPSPCVAFPTGGRLFFFFLTNDGWFIPLPSAAQLEITHPSSPCGARVHANLNNNRRQDRSDSTRRIISIPMAYCIATDSEHVEIAITGKRGTADGPVEETSSRLASMPRDRQQQQEQQPQRARIWQHSFPSASATHCARLQYTARRMHAVPPVASMPPGRLRCAR